MNPFLHWGRPRSKDRGEEPSAVYLFTWRKCGSQWTRDLITHHLVLHHAGFENAAMEINFWTCPDDWPLVSDSSVAGPYYALRREMG